MKENTFKGKLIAIDGPNGVGKSTIITKLKNKLESQGVLVYITKEPTNTDMGNFIREYAEMCEGISLACLVVANRYEHINQEIIPQLQEGKIVITDRYILSSLILQRMDGVDVDFICNINAEILKPDLQVAVFAEEEIIQKRLSERKLLTRFEKNNQSCYELKYLKEGICILEERGINVLCITNDGELDESVECIMSRINELYKE